MSGNQNYGDNKRPGGLGLDACRFYVGSSLMTVGFLVSGVFFIVAGAELDGDLGDVDRSSLESFYAIAGAGLVFALLGFFLSEPDMLCGKRERGRLYFGTMMILIAFVSAAGFIWGTALRLDVATMQAESDVQTYAYLTGVAYLTLVVGWIISFYPEMTCGDTGCNARSFGHYMITVFVLIAGCLFFAIGGLYDYALDDRSDVAVQLYLIGTCGLLQSIGAILISFFGTRQL